MLDDYSSNLRLTKRGFRVKLHGSNLELSMSAMGQKQTLDCIRRMSALPPKADISCAVCDVR